MKKLLAVLLSLALLFSFTGCGKSGGKTDDEETIFRVAISGDYGSLNPFLAESSVVYDFLNLCYDSLIAYDKDFQAIPRLAESWELSKDGLVWTFHLQKNAVFSDGEPVTSADVKWTYENIGESYMYSLYAGGIESIECPDDYTVVFNCEAPKYDMLYQIIPVMPEHVWSKVDDILSYETDTWVGSGPFIYDASRSAAGNVAFVRNDKYWGQKPYVDVLVFTPYDNQDAMGQAMKLGEVDACYDLDRSQYDLLKDDPSVYVELYEIFGLEHLAYNLQNEVTADKAVRYAVDYCFDRELAVEMGYGGLGEAGYGIVNNPGHKYEPPAGILREFNIDKAKEVLDKAGYIDTNGDGIRERNGEPLSLELITASERTSWQSAVVNMMITNCAKAGIEIRWTTLERVTMWDTCYDGNPEWQLNLDGWGGTADPAFIMCIFLNWETDGYSSAGYYNPEFDEAYGEVYSTIDPKERAAGIQECQRILYEDCPYTVVCYSDVVQAISTRWTGYSTEGVGLFSNERVDTYVNVRPAK